MSDWRAAITRELVTDAEREREAAERAAWQYAAAAAAVHDVMRTARDELYAVFRELSRRGVGIPVFKANPMNTTAAIEVGSIFVTVDVDDDRLGIAIAATGVERAHFRYSIDDRALSCATADEFEPALARVLTTFIAEVARTRLGTCGGTRAD
jgi:hypothetical protein